LFSTTESERKPCVYVCVFDVYTFKVVCDLFYQEKSKIDWNDFKHEEGISEELTTYNRGKDG